ncbi:hypothetical protein [Mycoplasma sp. CSL7503-lung]|uniref:hypothetical protein n=1 Tax=Mycoplasma sp. CSL7503-lung TaxID=536372 RepID=UPI0021D36F13|nr:hypothetical protein [Mycoplasma sp. CSL7503-lung]MCU4706696.1 hypothetical protein [Mycoplasma sp. CSL7503-lung]
MKKYTKSLLFLGFVSSFAMLASCAHNIIKNNDSKVNNNEQHSNNDSNEDNSTLKENNIISNDNGSNDSTAKDNEEQMQSDQPSDNNSVTKENLSNSDQSSRSNQQGSEDDKHGLDKYDNVDPKILEELKKVIYINLKAITASQFGIFVHESDWKKYSYINELNKITSKLEKIEKEHLNEIKSLKKMLRLFEDFLKSNSNNYDFIREVSEALNTNSVGHSDYVSLFQLLEKFGTELLAQLNYYADNEYRMRVVKRMMDSFDIINDSKFLDYTNFYEIQYQLQYYIKENKGNNKERAENILSIVNDIIENKRNLTNEEKEKINSELTNISANK